MPDRPVPAVSCSALNSSSILLKWSSLPPANVRGALIGYRVLFRKSLLDKGDEVQIIQERGNSLNLASLAFSTNYTSQVAALTVQGRGPFSAPVSCSTLSAVLQPPENLKFVRTSTTSVILAWQPPKSTGGDIYKFCVYQRNHSNKHQRLVGELASSSTTLPIGSLTWATRYDWWLTCVNAAGESAPSRQVTAVIDQQPRVGILSFSTRVAAVVTRPVTLDCITSRQSAAAIWKHNQRDLVSSHYHRLTHLANGSLFISHVTRSDEGDWSCSISSGETITVQLHPVTPPTVTSPQVVMATQSTLKVAWQLIDDGGMPIQKYHIRYGVRGSGEWRHLVWLEGTTEVLLVGLLCGTEYSVTVSADNTLTGGQHSQPLLAATNGNKPAMPSPEGLFITNSTCITLRLYDWLSECDVTQYTVRLQPVDSAPSPISRRPFSLFSAANDLATVCNLSAATWYRIVAEANSEAGSTKIESLIATLTSGGERLLSPSVLEHSNSWPKDLNGHLFAFSTITLALIITVFTVFCFVKFRRKMRSTGKRCPNHRSFTDVPGADQTSDCGLTLDHHYSTRECKRFDDLQPYATLDLRKLKYMDQSETCRDNGGNFCHYASVDAVTGICASKDEPAHCRTLQSGVSLQPFCANDITAAQQLQLASSVPPPPRRYTPMTEFAYQNVWSKDTVVLSPEDFLY